LYPICNIWPGAAQAGGGRHPRGMPWSGSIAACGAGVETRGTAWPVCWWMIRV